MDRRRSKAVELTPLLDVVLLLLFALFITMSQQSHRTEAELEAVSESYASLQEDYQGLNQERITLEDEKERLVQALETYTLSVDELLKDTEGNYSEIIASENMTKLDFIAKQFYFIDITFDADKDQQVMINNISTHAYLRADVQNDPEQLAEYYRLIFNVLEEALSTREGGYKNVLISLVDDGTTYNYAYEFIWELIKDIEVKYGTSSSGIYKLKYYNYK